MDSKPAKNVRTHRIILKDGREFPITEEQYDTLWVDKNQNFQKGQDPLNILDPDADEYDSYGNPLPAHKRLLFSGTWDQFKCFEKLGDKNKPGKRQLIVCDWGVRHEHPHNCNCINKYGLSWRMWEWLKGQGYNLSSTKDITEEMRESYLNSNNSIF